MGNLDYLTMDEAQRRNATMPIASPVEKLKVSKQMKDELHIKLGDKVTVAHFSEYYTEWIGTIATVTGLRLKDNNEVNVTIRDDGDGIECDGWNPQDLEITNDQVEPEGASK